ncbi:MAG: hypothetical protein NC084_01615 [Bacteroides sp.]|nr:hypothetical protein [Eubacterium sp.]MCM1419260.1 hypothetical protein [Roseburia sp.]MCM1461391.1 hypothetical protein [Bacteroides sp.]
MTEFNMRPGSGCIEEYIARSIFRGRGQKTLKLALYLSLALIALAGITVAILLAQPIFLVIAGLAVIAGAAFPLVTRLILKDSAKQLAASLAEQEPMNAAVSDMNLLFIKGGIPAGILEWSEITEIDEGKTGFFLKTAKDSVVMLARESVVSGTFDEAAQVLRAKRESLKKANEEKAKP